MMTMVTTVSTLSSATRSRPRWWWLPYLYLLRVQLIAGAILVIGPFAALRSSLLSGFFDLDYGSSFKSAYAMAVVSLAAFLSAWTLLASSVTTLLSAHDRFGTSPVRWVRFPIRWPEREAFGVLALFIIGKTIQYSGQASHVDRGYLTGGAILGMGVAVLVLFAVNPVADKLYRDIYNPAVRRLYVRAFPWVISQAGPDNLREGFIDPSTTRLSPCT